MSETSWPQVSKWVGAILVVIATTTTIYEKGFFEYLEYVSPVKSWIAIGGMFFIFVGLHFSDKQRKKKLKGGLQEIVD